MDDATFERIIAEQRALKRQLDAIVVPAGPPETWEEIEALCAKRRELLDISARLDVLEAEFERGCVRVLQ